MRRRPSRLAGESSRSGKKEDSASTIIVDSREFKAELPSALYRHGFKLLPFTLNICDYVLTPSIGVERKSFQDLVNSLNHGRLQKQMEHMARVYAYPLLLIEMNKRHYGLFRRTGEITRTAVKLVILMRSYPKMRILWSFQDSSSARMFELIKKGKQEPVLEKIMDTSGDSYLNGNKSDVDRIDLLLSFPGVNIDNAYAIFRRIKKLSDICSWSLNQFQAIMKPADAESLYRFLHTPFSNSVACVVSFTSCVHHPKKWLVLMVHSTPLVLKCAVHVLSLLSSITTTPSLPILPFGFSHTPHPIQTFPTYSHRPEQNRVDFRH